MERMMVLTTFAKKNTTILLLGSIMALASILRFYHIGYNPLMLDEAYSHWFAALTYKEHWTSATEFGIHPVLYYSFLKFWISIFGDGHFAMRSTSALASILTLPFVFLFGKNIGGEKAGTHIGLLSALFFAISPLNLEWAQMARPYAFMTLGVTMACAGFSWYLRYNKSETHELPHSNPRWFADICIVFGASLSLWSHNMSVLFILSMGLYTLWWYCIDKSLTTRTALHLIMLAMIAFLLWSPHAYWLISQTSIVTDNIFYVFPMTIASFGQKLIEIFGTGPPFAALSFVLIVPISWMGLKYCFASVGKEQMYLLSCLLLLPFVAEIALDKLFVPLMLTKTHLWATIPFFIAIAFGVMSIAKTIVKYSIIGMIILTSLAGSYPIHHKTVEYNWRALAITTLIEDKKSPILIYPNELALPLIYEAKHLGVADEYLEKRIVPLPAEFPALDLDRPTMAGVPIVLKTDVPIILEHIDNVSEFWIMASFNPLYDPNLEFLTEILKTHEVIEDHGRAIKLRRIDHVKNEQPQTN